MFGVAALAPKKGKAVIGHTRGSATASFQTVNLVLRRDDEMKKVRPPELQKRTNWERALTGCYRTIPRTRFEK
jgi:hypothetical protein